MQNHGSYHGHIKKWYIYIQTFFLLKKLFTKTHKYIVNIYSPFIIIYIYKILHNHIHFVTLLKNNWIHSLQMEQHIRQNIKRLYIVLFYIIYNALPVKIQRTIIYRTIQVFTLRTVQVAIRGIVTLQNLLYMTNRFFTNMKRFWAQ